MTTNTIIIDEKDRKILVELDKNSRQTDSEIAKKVGVSKQVANYRIQKLVERGIISNFYTIIDVGLLGLNSYYIFLQLEKINRREEKMLLENLSKFDYVGWLVSGTGRWDVVLLVYADSIATFDKLLNQIINTCGVHLHEYNFTTLIKGEHISYKFLSETPELSSVLQKEKATVQKLDKIDIRVLKNVNQNARLPIAEIARITKLPVHIINYRLKNFVKQKLIEGFKPKINVSKLGYQWHLLLIQFQRINEKNKNEFIEFCKQQKKIYYVTNTVGLYNLMLDIHVKNSEEFKEVLLELKDKFSDVIKLYESMIIFEEYKISYLPKLMNR